MQYENYFFLHNLLMNFLKYLYQNFDKNIKFYMVDIPDTEDLVFEETKNEVSVDKVDSLSYIWIFLLFFSVLSIGFIFIISKRKR